jgi:[ribosomal protein S18]-alanine N-acetyltransferase
MITYREPMVLDIPTLVVLDKEYFPYSPWSVAQFKEEFAGIPSTRFFELAISDNQIVGYAGVFAPGPDAVADILTVTVIDSYRRQGIAKKLISDIESYCQTKGSSAIMLEVAVDNTGAIALYEDLGYSQISKRSNYYGTGKDALVMQKELI